MIAYYVVLMKVWQVSYINRFKVEATVSLIKCTVTEFGVAPKLGSCQKYSNNESMKFIKTVL